MTKQKTKPVVFHCPEDLRADLVSLARRKGESTSVLLRAATRALVARERTVDGPSVGVVR